MTETEPIESRVTAPVALHSVVSPRPCPGCGNSAPESFTRYTQVGPNVFKPVNFSIGCACGFRTAEFPKKQDATDCWNQRANEALCESAREKH